MADWEYDVTDNKVMWAENLFRIFELDPTQQLHNYPVQLKLCHPRSDKRLSVAVDRAINDGEPF